MAADDSGEIGEPDPRLEAVRVRLQPTAAMTAVPVGLRVNNPRNDDASCVAEVTLA